LLIKKSFATFTPLGEQASYPRENGLAYLPVGSTTPKKSYPTLSAAGFASKLKFQWRRKEEKKSPFMSGERNFVAKKSFV